MAKKVDNKEINYKIERIRQPMSREELDKLANSMDSDDDFVNYHLDLIEEMNPRYLVAIMNYEEQSPKKESGEETSYGFMKKTDALNYLNDYIDSGKTNSKPKEVMRTGYSRKSIEKYDKVVEQEKEEGSAINQFTKPSFEDIMNNVYVNVYNGETYKHTEDVVIDEMDESVGFDIPGLVSGNREYWELVRRLKDRGRDGLGRTIYERYEDYVEATDIIERYKEALYNKYGGEDEYESRKDIGGFFGAPEYFPTVKPRFKKNKRNVWLDRGINLNELAHVKDMGARIREELDKEISQYNTDDIEFVVYENTPPKFADAPDTIKMIHKKDKDGKSMLDKFKKNKSYSQFIQELIRDKDNPDNVDLGYRLYEQLENERLASAPIDDLEYSSLVDEDLPLESIVDQIDYDRKLAECDYNKEYVDSNFDTTVSRKVFTEYMKRYVEDINGILHDDPRSKSAVLEASEYAVKYLYDPWFKHNEDQKTQINSAGEVLYRQNREFAFGREADRAKTNANDSKLKAYVKSIDDMTKNALNSLASNADVNDFNGTPSMSMNELTGGTIDANALSYDLEATPRGVLGAVIDDTSFAQRIYELSKDEEGENLFDYRVGLDEFIEDVSNPSKPFMTEDMVKRTLNKNTRGVDIDE